MEYPIIIESGTNNYSAYCLDLPGCVATGQTVEEVKQPMKEAIEMHIRGIQRMVRKSLLLRKLLLFQSEFLPTKKNYSKYLFTK